MQPLLYHFTRRGHIEMRLELPTHPDHLYSAEDIAMFDLYRQKYAKSVALSQRLGSDRVYTKPYRATGDLGTFLWQNDSIMAVYLPSDLRWFELIISNDTVGRWTVPTRPLDDILREARAGPQRVPCIPLDYILHKARTGTCDDECELIRFNMKIHSTHEHTTMIDGIQYTRVEVMQPFLPLFTINATIRTSDPCLFWTEAIPFTEDVYCNELECFFIEDQPRPLFNAYTGRLIGDIPNWVDP